MKKKNNASSNNFLNFSSNKDKYTNSDKNFKKIEINTYVHSSKNSTISKNKNEPNNVSILNEGKNRQKKLKKYLFSSYKNLEMFNKNNNNNLSLNKKEEEINENENENVKEFNATEIKKNKHQIKNIRVNKLKIEEVYKDNELNINPNSNTIRGDFYHKPPERNKSFNFYDDQNKFQNNMNLLYFLNNNKKNQRKSNVISVKSFNKNKDSNSHINSEYINFNNNNFSFYENNVINNNTTNYKKNKIVGTYSNSTTTGKSKISTNSSKILSNFKNIKTFYAHLEILISLYLKRNFKYFIEKIKKYDKQKNDNNNFNNMDSKNGPIINVNNAHCSLYCSININQDNENNNKLFNTVFNPNNTTTPITKRNEIENENINLLNKNIINSIKKNRLIFINPESEVNLSTNKKIDKAINKSVYVPKNKITKFNNDLNNATKIKNDNNKIINNYNNVKRSSPIKEMNINLKKINVCRLNDLNQLYFNQKLLKSNSSNISFSEMNNIMNMNSNSNIGHFKYYSNIIQINNNSNRNTNNYNKNNLSSDKNKLKKISSAKNGVYIKPKEKIIKEIKIQNNQNKLTPYKNDMYSSKTKNIKSDNIVTISNNFFKNKKNINDLSKLRNTDLYSVNYTHNNSRDDKNAIKKIYIRRNSKNLNKNNSSSNESKIEYNKNSCLSTLLSFKKNNDKNSKQNGILIKKLITSDKRIFININYVVLTNFVKRKNKIDIQCIQEAPQCSITIINNELILSDYGSMFGEKINMSDIFRFDNDKKKKIKNMKNNELKSVSFSFKDKSFSKEEKNKFIKLKKIIKTFVNNKYIKSIFNKYKKYLYLKKLVLNKKNKMLNHYLSKLYKKVIKMDKNNCVYHKINYNDDFNLNKRMKTPNNVKQNSNTNTNNNIHCKSKAYNLTSQNSINQNKMKTRLNYRKKGRESSSINFNCTQKYINKEINIFVHK